MRPVRLSALPSGLLPAKSNPKIVRLVSNLDQIRVKGVRVINYVTLEVAMSKIDSWHVVGAGGSDYVAVLSAGEELELLAGEGGNLWGMDPAALLEAAECGGLDCLREDV